jgi:zinc protease
LAVLDSLLSGASNLNMFGGGISHKTSRLYRALVDKEFAVSASGGATVTIDPFIYSFNLTVHPNHKPEETLAALDAEIQRIQEELVPVEEITRAIKQARAIFAYGSENITNQAFWMGFAEMFATYDWFTTYLNKLAKITPQDVQRVAIKYFQPKNRVVGTYIPKGTEG